MQLYSNKDVKKKKSEWSEISLLLFPNFSSICHSLCVSEEVFTELLIENFSI